MALHTYIENIIHALRYRQVLPHLKPCGQHLDLGCGSDYRFLKKIHSIAQKCYGLDIKVSEHVNGNITLIQHDIIKGLPFPDSSTDQITILAVIEHIHNPLPVLRECHRIISPGGRIILTTPSQLGIHVHELLRRLTLVQDVEEGEHQNFEMSIEHLRTWMRDAGFETETVYSFELGMNLLIVARKL